MNSINELLEMEALADLLQQRATKFKDECRKARAKLEGVSTPSSARKGLSAQAKAALIAKRNKRLIKH